MTRLDQAAQSLGYTDWEELRTKPHPDIERAALFDGNNATDIRAAFERGATVADVCWLMGALGMRAQIVAFANFCAADAARAARAAARAARAAYADAAYAARADATRADATRAATESQKAELIRLIEESE